MSSPTLQKKLQKSIKIKVVGAQFGVQKSKI